MNDLMTKIDVMQLNTSPILITETEINQKPTGSEIDLIIFTPAMDLNQISEVKKKVTSPHSYKASESSS